MVPQPVNMACQINKDKKILTYRNISGYKGIFGKRTYIDNQLIESGKFFFCSTETELPDFEMLKHPHLLRYIFSGKIDLFHFFVMEDAIFNLEQLDNIDEYCRSNKVKPFNVRLILRGTALALSYIHYLRFAHGDIKEKNILIVKNNYKNYLDAKLFFVPITRGSDEIEKARQEDVSGLKQVIVKQRFHNDSLRNNQYDHFKDQQYDIINKFIYHPMFWKSSKCLSFIEDIANLTIDGKSNFGTNLKVQLARIQITTSIPKELDFMSVRCAGCQNKYCSPNKGNCKQPNGCSCTEYCIKCGSNNMYALIQNIRNCRQHRFQYPEHERKKFGETTEDYLRVWTDKINFFSSLYKEVEQQVRDYAQDADSNRDIVYIRTTYNISD